ncbi:MAG: MarR family transcriptional regulator [Pseudorhodobacter sp.]|nr:MarR family transcriptional regulator [Rhizobacter sp.]
MSTSAVQSRVRRPTPAVPALALDGQLCFALYSTSLAMTKLYKPALEPLGITYPQYLVLLALWEENAQSVSELGARLFLDSGTLTPLLKRMETSEWLTRTRDAQDERRVIIHLAPAGTSLRKRAQNVPIRLAKSTGCSAAEMNELTRCLQQLRGHLHIATLNAAH